MYLHKKNGEVKTKENWIKELSEEMFFELCAVGVLLDLGMRGHVNVLGFDSGTIIATCQMDTASMIQSRSLRDGSCSEYWHFDVGQMLLYRKFKSPESLNKKFNQLSAYGMK